MNDVIMVTAMVLLTGCLIIGGIHNQDDNWKEDKFFTDETAMRCPLCGYVPMIRRSESQLKVHKGFKPPAKVQDARYLYKVGCCREGCMVSGPRVWSWSQKDAVEIWNKAVNSIPAFRAAQSSR